MKTQRPRIATNTTGYHVDERVSVLRRDGNVPALAVGDAVLLRFVGRVKFRDGSRGVQVLRVAVTNVLRDARGERVYRGEIEWEVDRKLFSFDELRRGQPVRFTGAHVLIVYRNPVS